MLGFYKVPRALKQPAAITKCLRSSQYDELLEIDHVNNSFTKKYSINDKYALPLTDVDYRDLFAHMSEFLVHPNDRIKKDDRTKFNHDHPFNLCSQKKIAKQNALIRHFFF
ncbi:MAG: hypothetical protein IJS17_03670 [Clostridia bacterium]|nr:hypothetical protein [Clostridia bacterium]